MYIWLDVRLEYHFLEGKYMMLLLFAPCSPFSVARNIKHLLIVHSDGAMVLALKSVDRGSNTESLSRPPVLLSTAMPRPRRGKRGSTRERRQRDKGRGLRVGHTYYQSLQVSNPSNPPSLFSSSPPSSVEGYERTVSVL